MTSLKIFLCFFLLLQAPNSRQFFQNGHIHYFAIFKWLKFEFWWKLELYGDIDFDFEIRTVYIWGIVLQIFLWRRGQPSFGVETSQRYSNWIFSFDSLLNMNIFLASFWILKIKHIEVTKGSCFDLGNKTPCSVCVDRGLSSYRQN